MSSFFEETEQYNAYLCDTVTKRFFHCINQKISILDFGCGSGLLMYFMHRAFFNATLVGIDNDPAVIQNNQKEYPELLFKVSSGKKLPFEDNSFDLIYSVNVMHHIPFQDIQKTIDELIRILKPNGTLIIFEFNPYNMHARKTFKKEHGIDFKMMKAGYLKNKFKKKNLDITLDYLYPNFSIFERYLSKIPAGPLYCLKITKLC